MIGDELLGLPQSLDTVALLRNREMVADVPSTFGEMISMGRDCVAQGKAKYPFVLPVGPRGDAFHMFRYSQAQAVGCLVGNMGNGTSLLSVRLRRIYSRLGISEGSW